MLNYLGLTSSESDSDTNILPNTFKTFCQLSREFVRELLDPVTKEREFVNMHPGILNIPTRPLSRLPSPLRLRLHHIELSHGGGCDPVLGIFSHAHPRLGLPFAMDFQNFGINVRELLHGAHIHGRCRHVVKIRIHFVADVSCLFSWSSVIGCLPPPCFFPKPSFANSRGVVRWHHGNAHHDGTMIAMTKKPRTCLKRRTQKIAFLTNTENLFIESLTVGSSLLPLPLPLRRRTSQHLQVTGPTLSLPEHLC